MSYTLTPYLVDLDELRRTVGSKDGALVRAIIQGKPERFEEDPDADPEDADEVSLRRALTDLVMGNPPAPGAAHRYGPRAACRQGGDVLADIALQGQDTDLGNHGISVVVLLEADRKWPQCAVASSPCR